MKTINKTYLFSAFSILLLLNCGGGAPIITTPVENIDNTPIKEKALTEAEAKDWSHLDMKKDTIPGMSVNKAYNEIIKGKRGSQTIVAVIDSGIDIDHEDLDGVIWTNRKEIPGNGIDDDKNGYVDDIHGWNFLGDGYDEQLEFVRILAKGDTSYPRFAEAQKEYDSQYQTWLQRKTQYEQIYTQLKGAHNTLKAHFKKEDYTKEEVTALKSTNKDLNQAKQMAQFAYSNGLDSMKEAVVEIKDGVEQINERLNFNLNKQFNGRKTGDNPDDFNDKPGYGNANVKPKKKTESHGTHVAGIIAAERNNGIGANGVANNVKIMAIRTVPNGDEYDKDVAKAIRYAVDNGAKVINGSFGKSFSPHSDWVREAIAYASKNDVVFVHAAGNDSKNVDVEHNYPDDNINGAEVSNSYIRVGSITSKYGTNLISDFSNYGKNNVDVFAPGSGIYSTFPENEYNSISGTSMAAPAVAGVAALIRSQFPKLKAKDVKQIIMDSGLAIPTKVIIGGDANNAKPMNAICKSGKIVNAYNALILASRK